jgi:hypothetical protein
MSFLILVLSCIINKFRGGGFYAYLLPGAPRYYAFILMGVLFYIYNGFIKESILFAIFWLIWSIPPWGRYYTLGRMPREVSTRKPSLVETEVEKTISDINNRHVEDHILFFIRNLISLLPFLYFSYLLPFIIAIFISIAYEVAWIITPDNKNNKAINYAEYFTGFVWGITIITI